MAITPTLTVGTENWLELYLLCDGVIEEWYRRLQPTGKKKLVQVNLAIREAYSRYHGLQEVEEGRWDVFIDGMRGEMIASSNMEARSLDYRLTSVLLVPKALEQHWNPLNQRFVTLADIRDLPIAFVDARGLGDKLVTAGHRSARVTLASNEAVKRFADNSQFAVICSGWQKMLPAGHDNGDKFKKYEIKEESLAVELYAYYRVDPRTTKLIEGFIKCVRDFLHPGQADSEEGRASALGATPAVSHQAAKAPVQRASRKKKSKG